MSEDFRAVGRRLSNWGRWGKDDLVGTLNHIEPAHVAAAAKLARTGRIFDLGIEVAKDGIQTGTGSRANPTHLMSLTEVDFKHREDRMFVADDYIFMPLQSVTQWDGLGHVGYDGQLYNGHSADTVSTRSGSLALSVHQLAAKGIAGRGVLLDLARLAAVDRLEGGFFIGPEMLERAEAEQGVKVGRGDILLFRTGWLRHFTVDRDVAAFWKGEPGLNLDCAEWLHRREVAAVASDNWGIEAADPAAGFGHLPVHCVLIRDMGMTLGEIFSLDALADDCANDGVWEFFLTAPPLKVVGGVGTPLTPLAIK